MAAGRHDMDLKANFHGLPVWAWGAIGLGGIGYLWWRNKQNAAAAANQGTTATVQATGAPTYQGFSGSDIANIIATLYGQSQAPTGLPQSTSTPTQTQVTSTTSPGPVTALGNPTAAALENALGPRPGGAQLRHGLTTAIIYGNGTQYASNMTT
jgi:hypothetical protein